MESTKGAATGEALSKNDKEWLLPPKCQHRQHPLVLPDGPTIYLSTYAWQLYAGWKAPDFGVYLDDIWESKRRRYPHVLIDWQDYGLPKVPNSTVCFWADTALSTAYEGGAVELGCIGGHGRTGTFAALLYGLHTETTNALECVKYVRTNYCDKAVETDEQTRWLGSFLRSALA